MAFEIEVNDNSDALVEGALNEESFDVFEFVAGTATPSDTVTLYTNAHAAVRIEKIKLAEKNRVERAKAGVDQYSIADDIEDDYQESEEELEELVESLKSSGLKFELKGLAPKALDALEKSVKAKTKEDEDFYTNLMPEIVARSIVKVTDAKGRVNSTKWAAEKIEQLGKELYPSEYMKLTNEVARLNYVAAVFDTSVTADFS